VIDKLFLDGSLGYSSIENLPFFVHSPLDSSRFDVVYDSASIVRTTFGLNIGYFASDRFNLNYALKVFGYTLNNLEEPWYKPGSTMNLLVSTKPADGLKVGLDLMMIGGIRAPSPRDFTSLDLPMIFDLGLSSEYTINNNLSAFAVARNLTGSDYERYLNYPVRGITFKLGLIYQFK
jgi:outer membrane receptor protein involved in Fe transport